MRVISMQGKDSGLERLGAAKLRKSCRFRATRTPLPKEYYTISLEVRLGHGRRRTH